MVLSRSLTRKLAATCGAVLGFVLLYEVTALDSKATAAHEVEVRETAWPRPGARLRFHATASCKGTTTASGTAVRTGIAAADPILLPVGSVVQVESLSPRYNGIYTVMDTGPAVQGREIDIYMWNCNEALAFGRRSIAINVLRLGWNPKASAPASIAANIIARPDVAAPGYPAGYGPAAIAATTSSGTPAATPVAVTAPVPSIGPVALADAPK
ncbi:MAG: 3D domain-containing protein [Vicinamibacteraceae bacterium]